MSGFTVHTSDGIEQFPEPLDPPSDSPSTWGCQVTSRELEEAGISCCIEEGGDCLAERAAVVADAALAAPDPSMVNKGSLEHELVLTDRKILEYSTSTCSYAGEILDRLMETRERILTKLGRPVTLV